ncbi:nucleotidyltransferase domain-containing protein [Longimicrobium terrae]|uniref:Putative nucleotidyltransferase n=1 Tax=Longimicrobium terrae TaxID=1639882 RepID=A0A841H4W6_9BACT|nr:putative nucleotidyltransferase [Longimicrobium terrae]MBB6073275.1 putative nucleotidyltransferase [Longimicrobium terrae]NNC28716.1 nucleotidyltransferase domain-containing protein [Longimicrobium terrae]
MLGASLDGILGTASKVQLLRALLPLRTPVTGREVQRLAHIRSTAGVRQALDELTAACVLVRSGSPAIHQYHVNRDHYLIAPLDALFRAEGERMGRLAEILDRALDGAGVRSAVRSAVVFGSQARGDARPDSDLDLLLLTSGRDIIGGVEAAVLGVADELAMQLGLRVSPLVMTAERAAERMRDGDPLMKNILDEGRSVLGDPFGEVAGAW